MKMHAAIENFMTTKFQLAPEALLSHYKLSRNKASREQIYKKKTGVK